MKNKFGLSDIKLLSIERKIVNTKLILLDEDFILSKDIFDLEYLKQIHKFLFSDLYYEDQLTLRNLSSIEVKHIKFLLDSIKEICLMGYESRELIIEILIKLWELQIFNDGNTRTLLGYLSILNKAFILNLNKDLGKEIESKPSTFSKIVFVN